MLVDLEGAAAVAAGDTARDGVNAAGAEGPAPAEEGARVKVTFSHFQARLRRRLQALHVALLGCCHRASGCPTLLVHHLLGCVERGTAGRPAAVPVVRLGALMRPLPPAALRGPRRAPCSAAC